MIIALEGIDGAGKSTQASRLCDVLSARGVAVRSVKMALFASPAYTYFEGTLRRLELLNAPMARELLSSLVVLQTARIFEEAIAPALAQGTVVVCDRYLLGGRAYLESQDAPVTAYAMLEQMLPEAGLTVVLKMRFEDALRRCSERNDPMSQDKVEHLHAIYRRIEALSANVDHLAIQADTTPETITETILAALPAGVHNPQRHHDSDTILGGSQLQCTTR